MFGRFFLTQDKTNYNDFSALNNQVRMLPHYGVIAICTDLSAITVYTESQHQDNRVINTYRMEAPMTIHSSRSNAAGGSSILERNNEHIMTIANEIRAFDNGFFCRVHRVSLPQQELNNFEKTLREHINKNKMHYDPEPYIDNALEQTNEPFRLQCSTSHCINY